MQFLKAPHVEPWIITTLRAQTKTCTGSSELDNNKQQNIVRVSLDLSRHSIVGVRIETWKHGIHSEGVRLMLVWKIFSWHTLSICLCLMMAPSNRIMHHATKRRSSPSILNYDNEFPVLHRPPVRIFTIRWSVFQIWVEWVICVIHKQQICDVIKSTWTQISGEYFWHLIESTIKNWSRSAGQSGSNLLLEMCI